MLSKQLALKLKEEKEKDPSYTANLQCDRLIRTVSCKHDPNHAIRRTNINILQCFDEIKLYVCQKKDQQEMIPSLEENEAEGSKKAMSPKLLKRNQSFKVNNTEAEMEETDLKQIFDRIINFISLNNPSEWFCFNNQSTDQNLFDLIHSAIMHIDYNLKRNSDFINELTRLLDTSRVLKQEAQLKKLMQNLEEQKNLVSSVSQPPSPLLQNKDSHVSKEEKKKTKSFRGFYFNRSKSKSGSQPSIVINDQNSETKSNYLTLPAHQSRQISAASSLTNLENSFQKQIKLSENQTHEINNSDYNLLELEVEKISFYLDSFFKSWSKLSTQNTVETDFLKCCVEFQNILNKFNSPVVLNDLEKSLFKLNWLITSKSGFFEPNWKTSVVSITPSTYDSFIGVNLLKNYYKYVKYDFVSYKLFTRQLQLIQIGAILLNLIHRVIVFYRETTTLSSITSTLNGLNNGTMHGSNFFNDTLNPSLLSMTFSADRYRPISWSANHVTLYHVQNKNDSKKESRPASRSPSTRHGESTSYTCREDQIKKIKFDLFIQEMHEFLDTCSARLNIQAELTNRTGYFYIVNQSTGLVLQAVDFSSQATLKEQIEENQKRIKNSSIKGRLNGNRTTQTINKGPRFFLMTKKSALNNSAPEDQSLNKENVCEEQLWYYYLINGCIANKIIRSGHCMAASSLNSKSPVTFWPNVKTTNCSWYLNGADHTIVSGLSDDLVLDYVLVDEPPNQRYAVVIDTKEANKASQKWTIEFC